MKTTVAAIKMPPVMTTGNGCGEDGSNRWYSIRAAANNAAEIYIYDEIGSWGISARGFAEELAALGQINKINLHIHSPG
ncbi:Clp protease ClpP, partial [Salmonella enterica]|nr:Clp protease ClpP [Salmonella enterica]